MKEFSSVSFVITYVQRNVEHAISFSVQFQITGQHKHKCRNLTNFTKQCKSIVIKNNFLVIYIKE